MDEKTLRRILLHIANGLAFIHAKNLVHLDIKPDNIFLSINEDSTYEKNLIYKIGDLGHVTDIYDPFVEEGDSRYLAREVLQQKYQCLPKADVFSLALTIFVAVRVKYEKDRSLFLIFRGRIVYCRRMVMNGIEYAMENYRKLNIVRMDLMIYYW